MMIGTGLGLTLPKGRRQQIITATTAPVLAPLAAGDTIASAYTAGSYASTAGTISSAVATYLLNGVSVPASTVVAEGDSVSVTEAVTDSAGNTRTFSAGSQSVPYIAPTISGLADLSASYGASVSINAALMASGSALVYSLTGPAWLSINSTTGMITGIAPEADVSTTATVAVTNPAGSASDDFAVTVADDAFTPASLFSSGEPGAWFDPSDLSSMWQDAAGTTPVTAAGQPVGLILDKSGRGNHASQPTAAARPTLIQDGSGKYCLSFDGVDDGMMTPTITPGTDKAQVFAGVRRFSDTAGLIAEYSANFNANVGSWVLATGTNITTALGNGFHSNSRGTASGTVAAAGVTPATFVPPVTAVLTATHDISADLSVARGNGVAGTNGTADKGTGNFLAYPLYIGRRNGTTLPFNGQIYSLIVRFGPNLNEATIAKTEAWLNTKTGAY